MLGARVQTLVSRVQWHYKQSPLLIILRHDFLFGPKYLNSLLLVFWAFFSMLPCVSVGFFITFLKINILFKNFKILYWNIVDLQSCVSRCTAKWFSYPCTCNYSLSNSFPIQVITEYWSEFPVLYNRSLLVLYLIYICVCVCVHLKPLIYPSPAAFSLW